MNTREGRIIRLSGARRPASRARDVSRQWNRRPANVTYLSPVTPSRPPISDSVRAAQFGAYVNALVEQLQDERGMTVAEIAKTGRVSRQTLNRWRRGDWRAGKPKTHRVQEFHDRLSLDAARAVGILVDAPAVRVPTADPLLSADPDVREDILVILRRLRDPDETDEERYYVRRQLGDLARRPGRSSSGATRDRNRDAG